MVRSYKKKPYLCTIFQTKRTMNYSEAIEVLYNQAPMFQHVGKSAYKTGLDTTLRLDQYFGHRHREYKTIHIAGTNGKGSTSHLTAAILAQAGYRVGLYTSPHLKDFRERIRVNGAMISEGKVAAFVARALPLIEELRPSFFELTTAMAFDYFAEQRVDVAVIEVGLGGRLDCTNIIMPELSVITNISLDHTDLLGDSLQAIAREKAGVIKAGVPLIVGETQPEVAEIFVRRAEEVGTSITFADREKADVPLPPCEMHGTYQDINRRTVLAIIDTLRQRGLSIPYSAVTEGMARVCSLTGIMGRWQTISDRPRTICDTGHNEAGIGFVADQLQSEHYKTLRIVIGMVSDKDISHILTLLPRDAVYYFTKAHIPRALDELQLKERAAAAGLSGEAYPTVAEALQAAKNDALQAARGGDEDLIFVGGSNFTVAEAL